MRAYVLSKTATLLGEACRSLSCLDFAHFPSDRRLQLALRCHNNWQPANCWATSLAKPSSETRYPQIQNGLHTSISYQYIIIFSYVSHIFPMKVYNHKMVKYPIEPWDAAWERQKFQTNRRFVMFFGLSFMRARWISWVSLIQGTHESELNVQTAWKVSCWSPSCS